MSLAYGGSRGGRGVAAPFLLEERCEFICGDCGYGVVVAALPDRCPMCHGRDWRLVREAGVLPLECLVGGELYGG